jgi:periplasmic divalent cation tolerance protein
MEAPDSLFSIVLVTAPSREQAEHIARALVEAKLAACVSFLPIHSVYTWNDEIQSEAEWQLLIKSKLSVFPQLEAKVRSLHPYEVPEIIAIPMQAGSNPYLQWIADHVDAIG